MLTKEEEEKLEEMKKAGKVKVHMQPTLYKGLELANALSKQKKTEPTAIKPGARSTLPRITNINNLVIVPHDPKDFQLTKKHFLNNVLIIQKRLE